MYDISVIVPVYNVEKYIKKCLDSILNQTMTNIQIIIVNDGSTDSSIQCIQNHINNSNILLINKKNGGLSSARNEGLNHATGKYISFIDGDDYIECDFLESLYSHAIADDLDITFGNYKKYKDKNYEIKQRNPILFTNEVQNGIEYLHNQLKNKNYQMEVWCNLYKREFISSHSLEFKENLFFEDEEFNVKTLLVANKVKLINSYGYVYRQRSGSIMTKKPDQRHIGSIKYILEYFIKIYQNTTVDKLKQSMGNLIFYMTNAYISKISLSNEPDKANYLDKKLIYKSLKIINQTTNIPVKFKIKFLLILNFSALYFKTIILKYKWGNII